MDDQAADDKDFAPSEQSSSLEHRQELVGPDMPSILSKRRRDSEEAEKQSSTTRQANESTDSCLPTMQNSLRPFPTSSGESAMEKSNKRRRVQYDGPEDVITTTILYIGGGYIHLNAHTYTLEMSHHGRIPDRNQPSYPDYLFHWEFKAPQAAQLTVQNYYVDLDTSTSPPKIVLKPSADNVVALVRRSGANEKWMLFFSYKDKCYQLKVENGAVALEERKSPDEHDLNHQYMFETSQEL